MDVTQCQTVNIAKACDPVAPSNSDSLSDIRDKTVTFSANLADMEVTQCLTGNIAADHILDVASTRGDRTVTISADMDMTQCHMDNIASHWATPSVSKKRDSTFLPSRKEQNFSFLSKSSENGSEYLSGNRPSTGRALNPGFKSLSKRSATWTNPVIVKAAPATPASVDSEDTQVKDYIAAEREPSSLVPVVPHSPENAMVANRHEEDVSEAQSKSTLGPKHLDEPPQCALPAQVSPSHSVDATEAEESAAQQIGSPDFVAPSRESKRMSFADLQSKVRRLSQMVHAAPGHTAPLPQLEAYLDCYSKDESQPLNENELDVASGERGGDTQTNSLMEEGQNAATSETTFKLKSAELVSRLSVGEFKPRLPQRGRSIDAVKATPIQGQARTVTPGSAGELHGLDCNVSDLYDEELGSCEDMSGMLEMESPPHKATETASVSQELAEGGLLQDEVLHEGDTSDTNLKKRPLTSDEDHEEQKKRKTTTEMATNIDMVCEHGALGFSIHRSLPFIIVTTQNSQKSQQCVWRKPFCFPACLELQE